MDPKLEKSLVGTYCVCHNISYNEVCLFLRNMKSIKDIDGLRNYFVISDKCKLCTPDIQKIVEFYNKQP